MFLHNCIIDRASSSPPPSKLESTAAVASGEIDLRLLLPELRPIIGPRKGKALQ